MESGKTQPKKSSSNLKLKKELIRLKPTDRLYPTDLALIGLTGGIASGKSTVLKILQENNLPTICADEIVKEIYRLPTSLEFIKNNFPTCLNQYQGEDQTINFPSLRQLVFSDPAAKLTIENFIYPQMPTIFINHLQKIKANFQTNFVIYDIPLLFEKSIKDKFDQIIMVYCPEKIQIERLMKRDQISEDLAIKMIHSQFPMEEKKKLSDFIIDNQGSLKDLQQQVELFLEGTLFLEGSKK